MRAPEPDRAGALRAAVTLALLAALVAATVVLGVAVGAAGLSPAEVVRVLGGGGEAVSRIIVLELRLPRALLALLAGGALALAGAVFQALLRNPLAEPYVLGVAGGAAVGAVGATVAGLGRIAAPLIPLSAFAGALLAIVLVFAIALRATAALDTRVLLLAGVVVGAFFNAVILLLLTMTDVESFRSAIFWTMGSLAGASWRSVGLMLVYVLPAALVLLALARSLNLLALGEETAHHLGSRVEHAKRAAFLIASLLVGAAVALCGVIGFVGLIVPHAIRMTAGSDHRLLLPASFLAGGAFLGLADITARTVTAPAELPVGVITALVGVPMFVLLLLRRRA
jgi:iron complex transport system permease protein